ncbi:MFS transporter [Streptomyces sp. NPDC059008]|uniref:MFS transporter n=1 Tax=Streptomyces sp. NPDC059008 TaxID=3346693 RepID=UPI0036BBA1C8
MTAGEAASAPPRTPPARDARLPERTAGPLLVGLFAAAYCGVYIALVTPVTVTLAVKAQQIAPHDKQAVLSLALGTGSVLAILGNPLFGRLSDRTTSRFGMRRPWLVGGLAGGLAGLLVCATTRDVATLVAGWCLTQLGFNAVLAALIAVLPDQIPEHRRGAVSGVLGLCLSVALVVGSFLAQAVSSSVVLMFMVPAGVGALTVLALVAVLRDRRLTERPPFGVRELARSYWVDPRRHPDFGWAWLSRCLMFMGTSVLSAYKTFYLSDHLGYPAAQVPRLVFWALLTQTAVTVVSSQLSGWLSDRRKRRKPFVVGAAVLYGLGLLVISLADSFALFLLGMAITGIGFGTYLSVDLALVTDVLPSRATAGRDLGVFNIATALPQSLAPTLAPAVLAVGGGENYALLFLLAALCAVAGAAALQPVRAVR